MSGGNVLTFLLIVQVILLIVRIFVPFSWLWVFLPVEFIGIVFLGLIAFIIACLAIGIIMGIIALIIFILLIILCA